MKKSKDQEIKYFTVKISADPELLREARNGLTTVEDIIEEVTDEIGWLGQSGIFLQSIRRAKA